MDEQMKNIPAFPTNTGLGQHQAEGMTLRDYFAAKAMQSIMASDRYMGVIGVNRYQHRTAEDAYQMADAMLKQRNQ
jgi:hypothetical protein